MCILGRLLAFVFLVRRLRKTSQNFQANIQRGRKEQGKFPKLNPNPDKNRDPTKSETTNSQIRHEGAQIHTGSGDDPQPKSGATAGETRF